MRIGINGHILAGESAGVASYASSLLESLVAVDRENEYLLFGTRCHLEPLLRENVGVEESWLPIERRAVRIFWEHFILPLRARMKRLEVLHLPDHTYPLLDPLCPSVITIHDVAFLRCPETFNWSRRFYKKHLIRQSANKASQVIVDSEHTKKDLLELLTVPETKVSVISLAAHKRYRRMVVKDDIQRVLEKHGLPEQFILYVGTIEPRKNVKVLLRAYNELLTRGETGLPLIMVGRTGWLVQDVVRLVEALALGDHVRFTGFIPDADLPAIYNAAEIFVYPSLYEGFGLPVLEAMACGTPVVTSNTSSIPEVVGDGAIMVDPRSVRNLVDAMHQLLTDKRLREDLSAKGMHRAEHFSWEETARRTLQVYGSVYARRR